jgi:hypothetical protein
MGLVRVTSNATRADVPTAITREPSVVPVSSVQGISTTVEPTLRRAPSAIPKMALATTISPRRRPGDGGDSCFEGGGRDDLCSGETGETGDGVFAAAAGASDGDGVDDGHDGVEAGEGEQYDEGGVAGALECFGGGGDPGVDGGDLAVRLGSGLDVVEFVLPAHLYEDVGGRGGDDVGGHEVLG